MFAPFALAVAQCAVCRTRGDADQEEGRRGGRRVRQERRLAVRRYIRGGHRSRKLDFTLSHNIFTLLISYIVCDRYAGWTVSHQDKPTHVP
eukprot:5896740-Prymnesium_polylepis.1